MGRTKYITDDYIEKVEHYLYNNLGLPPEDDYVVPTKRYDPEVAKHIAKEGEEFKRLQGEHDHVIVSNLGRLVNTATKRQYSVRFTPYVMILYICNKHYDSVKLFESMGWNHDIQFFRANYEKYG